MERLCPFAHEEYKTLSYLHFSKLQSSEVQNNSLYPHSIIKCFVLGQAKGCNVLGRSQQVPGSFFIQCFTGVCLYGLSLFLESGPSEIVSIITKNQSCSITQNQWCWETFLNFIGMSSMPKMTHNSLWIHMLNMIARYFQVFLIDMLLVQFFFNSLIFYQFIVPLSSIIAIESSKPQTISTRLCDFLLMKVQFSTFYSKYIMKTKNKNKVHHDSLLSQRLNYQQSKSCFIL